MEIEAENIGFDREIPKKYIRLQKRDRKLLMIWDWYKDIILEYQKIINLLKNTLIQPSKFRTENWVEINYDSFGTCDTNSQTKFKTSMLKSSLCDYSDVYIFVKET